MITWKCFSIYPTIFVLLDFQNLPSFDWEHHSHFFYWMISLECFYRCEILGERGWGAIFWNLNWRSAVSKSMWYDWSSGEVMVLEKTLLSGTDQASPDCFTDFLGGDIPNEKMCQSQA